MSRLAFFGGLFFFALSAQAEHSGILQTPTSGGGLVPAEDSDELRNAKAWDLIYDDIERLAQQDPSAALAKAEWAARALDGAERQQIQGLIGEIRGMLGKVEAAPPAPVGRAVSTASGIPAAKVAFNGNAQDGFDRLQGQLTPEDAAAEAPQVPRGLAVGSSPERRVVSSAALAQVEAPKKDLGQVLGQIRERMMAGTRAPASIPQADELPIVPEVPVSSDLASVEVPWEQRPYVMYLGWILLLVFLGIHIVERMRHRLTVQALESPFGKTVPVVLQDSDEVEVKTAPVAKARVRAAAKAKERRRALPVSDEHTVPFAPDMTNPMHATRTVPMFEEKRRERLARIALERTRVLEVATEEEKAAASEKTEVLV